MRVETKIKAKQTIKKTIYRTLPHKYLAELEYTDEYMRKPDFKNPTRFSEKMWLLKMINGNRQKKLLQQCYDKYRVREYVRSKLGEQAEELLNDVYGIYNSAKDIDFADLPEKFVLKVTQSSGFNYLCPDKSVIDETAVRNKLETWLKHAKKLIPNSDLESYLCDGNARIVCEKLLVSDGGVPYDLKVFCFNGEPKYLKCNRNVGEKSKWEGSHGAMPVGNTYDLNWNLINIDFMEYVHDPDVRYEKPLKLDMIKDVSRKLSADFPFARIDFLMVDNRPYFGEITFVHNGGHGRVVPDRYDRLIGSMLDIDKYLIYAR